MKHNISIITQHDHPSPPLRIPKALYSKDVSSKLSNIATYAITAITR